MYCVYISLLTKQKSLCIGFYELTIIIEYVHWIIYKNLVLFKEEETYWIFFFILPYYSHQINNNEDKNKVWWPHLTIYLIIYRISSEYWHFNYHYVINDYVLYVYMWVLEEQWQIDDRCTKVMMIGWLYLLLCKLEMLFV